MPQVTTVIGRETNILVQSDGQTWRAIRNGPISVYGAGLIELSVLATGTSVLLRGSTPVHRPPPRRPVGARNVGRVCAAARRGVLVALQRRGSGGSLAWMLTNVTWSTIMLFVLPVLLR